MAEQTSGDGGVEQGMQFAANSHAVLGRLLSWHASRLEATNEQVASRLISTLGPIAVDSGRVFDELSQHYSEQYRICAEENIVEAVEQYITRLKNSYISYSELFDLVDQIADVGELDEGFCGWVDDILAQVALEQRDFGTPVSVVRLKGTRVKSGFILAPILSPDELEKYTSQLQGDDRQHGERHLTEQPETVTLSQDPNQYPNQDPDDDGKAVEIGWGFLIKVSDGDPDPEYVNKAAIAPSELRANESETATELRTDAVEIDPAELTFALKILGDKQMTYGAFRDALAKSGEISKPHAKRIIAYLKQHEIVYCKNVKETGSTLFSREPFEPTAVPIVTEIFPPKESVRSRDELFVESIVIDYLTREGSSPGRLLTADRVHAALEALYDDGACSRWEVVAVLRRMAEMGVLRQTTERETRWRQQRGGPKEVFFNVRDVNTLKIMRTPEWRAQFMHSKTAAFA